MAKPPNRNKNDIAIRKKISIITRFPLAQFFLLIFVASLNAQTNNMTSPMRGNPVIKIVMAQSFTLSTWLFSDDRISMVYYLSLNFINKGR